MRRAISCLAVVLCILTVLPRVAAAQGGRVSGVVSDEDGRPIKAATVAADYPDAGLTMTATTDEKGRFSMIGLRSGRWNVIAQAPGYAPRAGILVIRAVSQNAPVLFELLRRGDVTGPLAGTTAKDLQVDLAAADALFDQQKWDDAVGAYRGIVVKMPGLATMVNLQVAAAFRNKKDFAAALATYEEMLKADPDNERAVIGISDIAVEQGDTRTAEETLTKAAETGAGGRDVFCSLGDLKLASGDVDAATNWYRKAAVADPSWGKPLYKLGMVSLNKGDQSSARTFMDQVVAVDPESVEAALARSALGQIKR